MRGLRLAAVLALLPVALPVAACGRGGGILHSPQDSASPGITQTVAPPVGGSRSPRPKPSGKRAVFAGVVMYLPAGWRLAPPVGDSTCALPPGQVSCLGATLTIKVLPRTPSYPVDWPGATLDRPGGWQGNAPPVCYAAGAVDPDHADVSGGRISARGKLKLADGRTAAYRQWEVPCSSGKEFTVKLWYVADKRVVFYSMGASPEYGSAYEQIVKSADLSGHRTRS